MPALKPQARYLLRGSALLIVLLVLWWFALMNPLLYVIKAGAEFCGSAVLGGPSHWITETEGGDWSVEVPIEATIPPAPGQSGPPTNVHSIDFDLARSDAAAFTFGLPVYWGLLLAAPGMRRGLRPLVLGTLVLSFLEIVLLLLFVEIFAHRTAAQWSPPDALAAWGLRFGDYMVVNTVPYVLPFVIAVWLDGRLRWLIFRWGSDPAAAPVETKPEAKPARRRGRR